MKINVREEYDHLFGRHSASNRLPPKENLCLLRFADGWVLDREVTLSFNFKYRIQIQSAQGGVWSMSLVSESDTLFSNPGVPSTSGTIGGIPVQKKSPREVKSGQNPRDIVAEADMHELGIFCSTTDTLEMEEDFKNALKISNNPIGFLASLLVSTEEDLKPKQLFAAAHQHSTETVLRQVGGINSVLNNLKRPSCFPQAKSSPSMRWTLTRTETFSLISTMTRLQLANGQTSMVDVSSN
jgi:hypothetical protein